MGEEIATRNRKNHSSKLDKFSNTLPKDKKSRYQLGKTYDQPSLEDITKLHNPATVSTKVIARAIMAKETEETKRRNIAEWKAQVTPAKNAVDDSLYTIGRTPTLFLNAKMNKIFNIMAVEGHAQQGHATYRKQAYPNTTRPDIIKAISQKGTPALKRNFANGRFEETTQEYIDNIVETLADGLFAMEAARKDGKKLEKISIRGLNGISCFGEVSPLDGAMGFLQSTSMDTKEIRNLVFQKYGFQMGTGESFLTNMRRSQELGINIRDMAGIRYQGDLEILNQLPSSNRLKVLENLKVIKANNLLLEDIASGELTWKEVKKYSNSSSIRKDSNYQEEYIRHTIGHGVGDDLDIFLAGFLPPSIYNEGHKESPLAVQSKIILALFGDQIDTLRGDQDSLAGTYLNGIFNKLAQNPDFREAYDIKYQSSGKYTLVPQDELIDFTLAGANTKRQHVHSSQRYFWKDEDGTCAVTEYIKHAYFCAKSQAKEINLSDLRKFKIKLDKDISSTKLTFNRIHAQKILSIMNERLDLVFDKTSAQRESGLGNYFLPN